MQLEAQRTSLRESIAALAEKTAGNEQYDRARGDLSKLEALLTSSQPMEAKDEEYARESAVAKLELEKAKQEFDAKWLEAGVALQKPALDEALKQVTNASRATTTKTATEEDLTKAAAAIDTLGAVLERGAVLETKDPKYAQFASAKKAQLDAQKKALEANRKRVAVLVQQDKVTQAKTASDQAMAALRKTTEEPAFEAVQTSLTALEEALNAGKELEAGDANYLKFANTTRAAADKIKAEVVTRRTAQKVAVQKAAVETARAAAKAAVAPAAPATPNVEEAEKAVAELEKVLEAGKEFVATDKTYAQFAATAAKEAAAYKTSIDKIRQQTEVATDREKVTAAVADVEAKMQVATLTPSAEAFADAEKALAALDAVLKSAEPLGAKDKTYAAELAAHAKKAAAHKLALTGKTNEQKIALHRAELEAQKVKVAASLEAIKGKLEQELYLKAEDEVAAMLKIIDAGESLGAENPKYAAELAKEKNSLPAQRQLMRITRVEAAKVVVAERLKVIEGDADDAAFTAAAESVRTLASTVEAAKSFSSTDKNYLAAVAAAEKQVPNYQAAIEKSRTGLAVRKHRAAIDAAGVALAEKMKALEGEPDAAAFRAAETAVSDLKSAIESEAAPDTDKTHAAFVAAQTKRVETTKAQILARKSQVAIALHKKERETAAAAVKEKIAALAGEAKDDAFSAAEEAVGVLESVIKAGGSATDNEPKYAKELEAAQGGVAAFKAQIEKRRTEVAVAANRAKIDAAAAEVAKEVGDASLDELERALADAEGVAAKDAKLAALVASLKAKVPAQRAALAKKKSAEKVAAHRAEVAEQNKKIDENIAALKGKLDQALYQAAETSITGLSEILEKGESLGDEDAKYGAELKAALAAIPNRRASLRKFRVEAASAQVVELVKALGADAKEEAFEEAGDAVEVMSKIVDAAKAFSSTDKNYLAFVAASEKQIPVHQAAIEKKRASLVLTAHKAKVDAASAALSERMKALAGAPDPAVFEAAESGAKELEAALEWDAKKVPDKAHETYLAAQKNKLAGYRATIEKRRGEVALIAQRTKIEQADAAVKELIAALGSEESLAAADRGVKNLEQLVSEETATKDKNHLKFLATVRGKLPGYQKAVEKQRSAKAIEAHQTELAAAEAALKASMDALQGKTDQELYIAAEDAVANLKKVVEAGSELGEKDPAYGKKLAALSAAMPAQRLSMRKKRVEATNAIAAERIKELEAKPEDASFIAAEKALRDLSNTIESAGGGIGKDDPQFVKFLDASTKSVAAYRARVEKRRGQIAVDAHKAELEEAQKELEGALGALNGKPEPSAFDAAEKSVTRLETTINSGSEAAEKSPEYAKRLAGLRGKLDGYRAQIEKRRGDAEVGAHREQTVAAAAVVTEKLGALAGDPKDDAFAAAEEAISNLESVVKDGNSLGEKNKAYGKELAGQQQKIAGYKSRIAKGRADVERKALEAELATAESEVAEKVAALGGDKADAAAFDAADESVAELEKAIDGAAKAGDKTLAKRLASLKQGLGKKRAVIAAGRVELELAAHRHTVDVAVKEVEKRIGALDNESSEGKVRAAVGSVKELEMALSGGDALAKKSKKHAQYLASFRKKAGEYRATISKKAIEDVVKEHRDDVLQAQSELSDSIKALEGQLEYSLYSAAEDSVSKLRKVIERGAPIAEKDPGYEKELAAAGAQADAQRVLIRRKWIEAADGAATEKMKALDGKTTEAAFSEAVAAVRVLQNTAESGKTLAARDKGFGAFVAASEKKAVKYTALIERKRSEMEFSEVRAELDEAVKTANEKMAGVSKEAETAELEAASDALDSLEKSIDANGAAAEKDKTHAKKLGVLKKKVLADRGRLEKLKAVAELAPFKAKLATAEKQLGQKVAALKGEPEAAAFEATEEAITELEGILEEGKALASQKAAVAKAKKQIVAARAAIKAKEGWREAAEHHEKVEAALAAAKEAVGGDDLDAARSAVKELSSVIEDGSAVAKKDKKHAKYLAVARKTGKSYSLSIKKKVADAERAEKAEEIAQAKAERAKALAEEREAKQAAKEAKLAKIAEAKEAKLAKAKEKAEAAREAKRAAKEAKLEKIAAAKEAKARKAEEKAQKLAEAKEAKRAAKEAKLAAKAAEAASEEPAESEEEEEVAEKAVNPTPRLAAAQAAAKKKMKALGPKPNEEKLASAREAIDELANVVDSTAGEAKKFKGYGKKLAKARAQLVKSQKALAKREAAFAKSAKATLASENVEEPEGDEESENSSNGNGHKKVDHLKTLKATWATFTKRLKVLKAKKPSLDDFEAALEAASDVELALKDGDAAGAAKNPKYKKTAATIKKKLVKERAKIKKRRDASEYT